MKRNVRQQFEPILDNCLEDVQELKSRVVDLSDERSQFMDQFDDGMPQLIRQHYSTERAKVKLKDDGDDQTINELTDEDIIKL